MCNSRCDCTVFQSVAVYVGTSVKISCMMSFYHGNFSYSPLKQAFFNTSVRHFKFSGCYLIFNNAYYGILVFYGNIKGFFIYISHVHRGHQFFTVFRVDGLGYIFKRYSVFIDSLYIHIFKIIKYNDIRFISTSNSTYFFQAVNIGCIDSCHLYRLYR